MVARDPQTGALLYKSGLLAEMLDQQRNDAFSYEHRDSRLDIPASFEDFSWGAGFEDAPDVGTAGFKGYNYTQGVDLSYGTRGYLSHGLQTAGSALATGSKKFLLTALGLFAIETRYVNRWSGSAWVQVLDSGAGGLVNDIFEFANSTDNYVVAALRDAPYQYTINGTTFVALESVGATATFRSAGVANEGTSATATILEPAGAAVNDILIASIHTVTATTIIPADQTFWNLISNYDSPTGTAAVFWGRRGGGAPNFLFSLGTSTDWVNTSLAYSGAPTTGSPINVTGSATTNASGTAHSTLAITTTGTNRLVIGVLSSPGNSLFTPPGGTTERAEIAGTKGSSHVFEIAAATAATYGPYTTTSASSVTSGTVAFSLVSAAPVGANNVTRWAMRGQSSGAPVLWAIDANGAIRNATLVNTPSNWSAADTIQVGQRNATQLGLEVIDNEFFLVHNGGITSYDGTTVSTVFASPFADPPSDAARPIMSIDNHLFLTYGNALLHFDNSTNELEKIWPRGLQEGNAELNGTITAMTANEKFVWFAIKNSAGNYYVMQLDHARTATVGDVEIYPAHTIAYRGSNAVTAMYHSKASSLALSTTNPQLIITSGVSVGYFILPRAGLRPEDDSNCRFDATADRVAFGSFVNFRAQGFPKWLTRGDIEAKTTTTETIALQYQVPAGTATALVTANTAQTGRTTAVLSTPVSFTQVRYKLLFNTSGNTLSPALRGVVLHAAPNAPRDRGFVFTVRLKDDQDTNEVGRRSRYQAANQSAFLFAAVNQIVTLVDIYGASYTVKVLGIQPLDVRYDQDGAVEELLEVTLGQLTS